MAPGHGLPTPLPPVSSGSGASFSCFVLFLNLGKFYIKYLQLSRVRGVSTGTHQHGGYPKQTMNVSRPRAVPSQLPVNPHPQCSPPISVGHPPRGPPSSGCRDGGQSDGILEAGLEDIILQALEVSAPCGKRAEWPPHLPMISYKR